jgi:hypothetical protein
MFCQPPESVLKPGAVVDWWGAMSRSTPARMWRQRTADGQWYDIWGHHVRLAHNQTGAYEEFAGWPLENIETFQIQQEELQHGQTVRSGVLPRGERVERGRLGPDQGAQHSANPVRASDGAWGHHQVDYQQWKWIGDCAG